MMWEKNNIVKEQAVELQEEAAALIQQIIITRIWNASHGGVYALIDDQTKPNPYLDDPERDITSRAGKRYTKINPAYMTRQIAELSLALHGYRFDLTSLKPLNPGNMPDPWEKLALNSFEHGATEQMIITGKGAERVFRFMMPLSTEQSCLQCHAKQHYRIGDIRGGISVSIPMKDSDHVHGTRERMYLLVALGLWLIIVTFIVLTSWVLSRKVTHEIAHELERNQLKTAVELAGAAAHEIRQPLTVLINFAHIFKSSHTPVDKESAKILEKMIEQCDRINQIVSKMQNITAYKTKPYVGDSTIVDLDLDPKKSDT
jgi:hypothetical protein